MDVLRYRDTRGLDLSRPTFSEVILTGTAEGGGLFVPESLPSLPLSDILSLAGAPYHRRVARILTAFGPDMPEDRIAAVTASAYTNRFDDPAIAPLLETAPGTFLLEQWHGPTAAFKDLALQCLPLLVSESITGRGGAGGSSEDLLFLVATSGDTGSAALSGFADAPRCRVAVLYPMGGISETQRLQMTRQQGPNTVVLGVRGSFDDCQNLVKSMFDDEELNRDLHKHHRLRLSSANSINWGRIPLQIASYASAYADLAAMEGVRPGKPVDICVPTGNFGNVLAAWYAKRIGVPIGRLICASNENDVLSDFLAAGIWDLRERGLVRTPSPSMDILISSNLERLLYEVSGDAALIGSWMDSLAATGRFEADDGTMTAIRREFTGGSVGNDDSLQTIRRMHDETGYLLDPHTAVAWEVAGRMRGRNPVIVVSTAHWAKFGEDVYRALNGIRFSDPLPAGAAGLPPSGLLEEITRLVPEQRIPESLRDLDLSGELSTHTIDASKEDVEEAIGRWLDRSGKR